MVGKGKGGRGGGGRTHPVILGEAVGAKAQSGMTRPGGVGCGGVSPPVFFNEVLGAGGPFRDGQIRHLGVDGLERGGVGEELRDALVWRPGVEPLHPGRVLLGLEHRPHHLGEVLLGQSTRLDLRGIQSKKHI